MPVSQRFNSVSRAKKMYDNKRVLVIGGGKSGVAAAKLANSLGARVRLVDEHPTDYDYDQNDLGNPTSQSATNVAQSVSRSLKQLPAADSL